MNVSSLLSTCVFDHMGFYTAGNLFISTLLDDRCHFLRKAHFSHSFSYLRFGSNADFSVSIADNWCMVQAEANPVPLVFMIFWFIWFPIFGAFIIALFVYIYVSKWTAQTISVVLVLVTFFEWENTGKESGKQDERKKNTHTREQRWKCCNRAVWRQRAFDDDDDKKSVRSVCGQSSSYHIFDKSGNGSVNNALWKCNESKWCNFISDCLLQCCRAST